MEGCKICGKREDNLRCGKCKRVRYCSKICQKIDYPTHKDECVFTGDIIDMTKKEPVNPCSICFEEEEDEGICGICLRCGNVFCGNCNIPSKLGRTTNCPMCRYDMDMTLDDRISKTRILIQKGKKLGPLYSNLGVLLSQRGSDEKEMKEAFQKSIDLGYHMGYYNYAIVLEGTYGEKERPMKYYQIAASMRNNLAQEKLASEASARGENELTRHWYMRSAENGNSKSQYNMGILCEQKKDYVKAREWYEKALENDLALAAVNLGLLYESGLGVEVDTDLSYKYYSRGAALSCPSAYYHLGRVCEVGYLAPSIDMALVWYTLGETLNDYKCITCLGLIYMNENNYKDAIDKFEKATALGCPISPCQLGDIYSETQNTSSGVKKDSKKAIDYYLMSGERGHTNAFLRLARHYDDVEKDHVMMLKYVIKAAKSGDESAIELLEQNPLLKVFS